MNIDSIQYIFSEVNVCERISERITRLRDDKVSSSLELDLYFTLFHFIMSAWLQATLT